MPIAEAVPRWYSALVMAPPPRQDVPPLDGEEATHFVFLSAAGPNVLDGTNSFSEPSVEVGLRLVSDV